MIQLVGDHRQSLIAVIMEIFLLQGGVEDSQQTRNEVNTYGLYITRYIRNIVRERGVKYFLRLLLRGIKSMF